VVSGADFCNTVSSAFFLAGFRLQDSVAKSNTGINITETGMDFNSFIKGMRNDSFKWQTTFINLKNYLSGGFTLVYYRNARGRHQASLKVTNVPVINKNEAASKV
jgi:hypothetical protein